jgi:hypothetical protein
MTDEMSQPEGTPKPETENSVVPPRIDPAKHVAVAQERTKQFGVDVWARVLGWVSLIVAGSTLFFAWLQPANMKVGVGKHILVNSKPRIGVLCTFANIGAQQAVIRTGSVQWDSPRVELKLAMVSTRLEEWTYTPDGTKQIVNPTTYTLVAPIAVKGHDQATEILWFTSDAPLDFHEGDHRLVISLTRVGGNVEQLPISLHLTAGQVESINKNPFAEFPVEVGTE